MVIIRTIKNELRSKGRDEYCFRGKAAEVMTLDMLVKEMVSYNSTITEADARAMLAVLDSKVRKAVNMGYKVELPFGYISLNARGTAEKKSDGFIAGKGDNKLDVKFKVKEDAKEDMTRDVYIKMEDTSAAATAPKIYEVNAINEEGCEEDTVEMVEGGMVRLHGAFLHFDATDEKQGVFIKSGKSIVKAKRYSRRGKNIVDFFIPSCASGAYNILIVTKPGVRRYEKAEYNREIKLAG